MTAEASAKRLTSIAARLLPFVVPAACCALALWLRPAGRTGPPDAAPWIDQLVYDDNDFTAYALRGLNARLGRHAGRRDVPERVYEPRFGEDLRENRSFAPRYYLEYPHAAQLLFELPYWFLPALPACPAALLDGAHEDVVYHVPLPDEAALWAHWHRMAVVFMVAMLACHASLVATLAAGYQPGGGLGYRGWLLIFPGVLFFSLNRFDVVPVMLTGLSFACLGRGRLAGSAVLLAAGTLVKVFPAFLAPLVFRYLLSLPPGAAARWGLVYLATLLAFLGPAVYVWGPDEVMAPYVVQLSRTHEGMTAYRYLVPFDGVRDELSGNGPVGRVFRPGTLAAVLMLLLARPIPELGGVLRRGAAVLITFMSLSVFYSPQWILWLTPLVLPLAGGRPRLATLVAILDLATWGQWPVAWRLLDLAESPDITRNAVLTLLAFARLAALGLIVWNLLRADRGAVRTAAAAEPALA
jgi:hypothetical protein